MVGVWACRGGWSGGGAVNWGGRWGHVGAELACLETPQQLLVGATQTLLLFALLLHVNLQVGVLLCELPGGGGGGGKYENKYENNQLVVFCFIIWHEKGRTFKVETLS